MDSIEGPVCVVYDSVREVSAPLSPEQSQYNVTVTDGLAHIVLTQTFVNPSAAVSDIVYVFPLPHNGSVHAMSMEYDDSLYVAEIREKEEARQVYDSVTASGGHAALLLQTRPNVFQQHLANIAKDDTAYVRVEVSMPLKYDSGVYELALPTMVAERYQSIGADPVPSSGTGGFWNPPENRDGQGLQINVLVQTGYLISNLQSPTHPLNVTMIVYGMYRTGGMHTVTLTGYRDDETVTYSKQVNSAVGRNLNRMVPKVWARHRIEELVIAEGTTTDNKDSIIALSVEYQVLSKYTAFLAINPEGVGDTSIAEDMHNSFPTEVEAHRLALHDMFRFFVQAGLLRVHLPDGLVLRELVITDLLGRVVFRFRFNEAARTGAFTWDGRLADGSLLKPGRYVVSIRTNTTAYTRLMAWGRR